jgi:hypothetical protein
MRFGRCPKATATSRAGGARSRTCSRAACAESRNSKCDTIESEGALIKSKMLQNGRMGGEKKQKFFGSFFQKRRTSFALHCRLVRTGGYLLTIAPSPVVIRCYKLAYRSPSSARRA